MSHPQFISVSVSPSSLSLSSSSLFCSPPALSKLYFLFRIVGNLFRPSSPILRMVLTIVTNAPPTPTQNSGDVSVLFCVCVCVHVCARVFWVVYPWASAFLLQSGHIDLSLLHSRHLEASFQHEIHFSALLKPQSSFLLVYLLIWVNHLFQQIPKKRTWEIDF